MKTTRVIKYGCNGVNFQHFQHVTPDVFDSTVFLPVSVFLFYVSVQVLIIRKCHKLSSACFNLNTIKNKIVNGLKESDRTANKYKAYNIQNSYVANYKYLLFYMSNLLHFPCHVYIRFVEAIENLGFTFLENRKRLCVLFINTG